MNTSTTSPTIMVVEDDPALRELLVLALEANEFGAAPATNSAEALAILQSSQIDLLLLDLKLGSESGIDLLKAIRCLPGYEKLPVILLTSCTSRSVIVEVAQLKVQGYILKHQFSRKDLTARIEQLLKNGEIVPPVGPADSPPPMPMKATDVCTPAKIVDDAGDDQIALGSSNIGSLRAIKPVLTRSQILHQVDRFIELKAFPSSVVQLLNLTAEPDCAVDQVAKIVKMDVAMSLKFLKIANSAVYGYAGTVDTAQQAILRIGVTQVRQYVLGMAVIENFRSHGLGEHFNTRLFWEHSIATGLIAAAITRCRTGDKHSIDVAFTMGLLHDVARMVFVEQLDDIYKRVLDTAARAQLPLELVESRMLLINHADAADRLLGAWNFPSELTRLIRMHHLPTVKIADLKSPELEKTATLVLADRLAHALLLGSSGNYCQYPTDELAVSLGIKPQELRLIEEKIPEQTADMKYAMLELDEHSSAPEFRQRLLAKLHRPIRPLYLSPNPEMDGYRILFDRLRQPDTTRPENLAVLRVTKRPDLEPLLKILRERETSGCLAPLPMIIISPLADPVGQTSLNGRDVTCIPSPFTLPRLIDAINGLFIPDDL